MKTKMVSVIIPMYNSENTIEKTLISAINQSYENIEIIIVNDGSKDSSVNIVESLVSKNSDRIIHLINQVNSGVSMARNVGIENASGEYIAFLDSDDSWNKDKTYKQVEILEKNPEICLLATGTKSKRNRGINRSNDYIEFISFYKLLFKNHIYTSSVMIRKEVFSTIGNFDINRSFSEDYDLWLRIAKKFKIAKCNEILTYYNSNDTGLASNLIKMQIGELLNYSRLLASKNIDIFTYLIVSSFSLLKFTRRCFKRLIKEFR